VASMNATLIRRELGTLGFVLAGILLALMV
jgi:hypothetical protein